MGIRLLCRILAVTVKAIIACRWQRAAPTLTTIFEIAALTAPLIKDPSNTHDSGSSSNNSAGSDTGSGTDTSAHTSPLAAAQQVAGTRSSSSRHHGPEVVLQSPLGITHAVLLLALRCARGWAPAVVVAQGVRLVASLVQRREQPHEEVRQEGTEVRALQLGLSAVPRVDPRVLRTLEQYTNIYREWLLLLRGRLAQSCIELPEGLFDPCQDGDEELMRFALCYNILQARSLKDALVAMDRTISNIKDFAAWYSKYPFITPGDLEAWQRICWWEGPDSDGYLWLMVDFKAAIEASRTHGPDLVARVLVSNMEYGVRQLIPELGCAAALKVVVDASGVNIGAANKVRGVFQRVGHIIDRMYPCRLAHLYMVGLPFPLRWAFRAWMQLLHQHTRRKIRMCRATDVPRRLPSQLRSHKLSAAAGLDTWAFLETQSYYVEGPMDNSYYEAAAAAGMDGASCAGGSAVGSELGPEPFPPRTPHSVRGRGPGALRRFRWRRGARGAKEAGAGGGGGSSSSRQRLRMRLVKQGVVLLCAILVLLLWYVLLLQRLLPTVAQPLLHRMAAVLQLQQ